MTTLAMEIRQRRAEAARRFKPERVKLLIVAEAPPSAPDRYFYFEHVPTQDSLFRYVTKGLFGVQLSRDKRPLLRRLRESGVFLVDLKLDPVDGSRLSANVPALIERCTELTPEQIILIKATVYDAAYGPMKQAGLPVMNARVPFPGSGQQRNFEEAFAAALAQLGWKP